MSDFHTSMRSITPSSTTFTPKPQVQQTLELRQCQKAAKNAILLFCFNSVMFAVIIFDIFYGGLGYKPFLYAEWFLATIFGINSVYHFVKYVISKFSLKPVIISAKQRKLLGVSDNDPLFKNEIPVEKKQTAPNTPVMSCMNISRHSLGNSILNDSKDYSVSSQFSKYNNSLARKSPMTTTIALSKSLNNSMHMNLTDDDIIQDERELQEYLKEVSKKESKKPHSMNVDQPSNLLSSFWSHPATRSPGEVSPMLRRCTYQLASTTDKSKSSSPGIEEGNSPRVYGTTDLWRKYRIDPGRVNHWIENLRMWLSKTVVERVAAELENVCNSFVRHGLSDSQPGNVPLDKLKKLAQSFTGSLTPTLPLLIPFLELSNNQDYLVNRIKTLARGGSMSEFKWNSGGSHNGKEWNTTLPTDTAIVMHLFATYMDTQLEAPINQPDARPFSMMHTAKSGFSLPRSKGPVIVNQTVNPPHYCLALTNDSINQNSEDIPRGRNNLFYTLLLFLYVIKTRDNGMLGRVNLGTSGVNVLWVID